MSNMALKGKGRSRGAPAGFVCQPGSGTSCSTSLCSSQRRVGVFGRENSQLWSTNSRAQSVGGQEDLQEHLWLVSDKNCSETGSGGKEDSTELPEFLLQSILSSSFCASWCPLPSVPLHLLLCFLNSSCASWSSPPVLPDFLLCFLIFSLCFLIPFCVSSPPSVLPEFLILCSLLSSCASWYLPVFPEFLLGFPSSFCASWSPLPSLHVFFCCACSVEMWSWPWDTHYVTEGRWERKTSPGRAPGPEPVCRAGCAGIFAWAGCWYKEIS